MPGNVIIQSYNPDNFSIVCSKKQDYDMFYETEIELRRQLKYPPFCDIILIGLTSTNLKEIEEESNKIYKFLKNNLNEEETNTIRNSISNLINIENKIQKYLSNQKPKELPVRKLSIFK